MGGPRLIVSACEGFQLAIESREDHAGSPVYRGRVLLHHGSQALLLFARPCELPSQVVVRPLFPELYQIVADTSLACSPSPSLRPSSRLEARVDGAGGSATGSRHGTARGKTEVHSWGGRSTSEP